MRIHLRPAELVVVGGLAVLRRQISERHGFQDHGRPGSLALDAIGAKGEVAFRRLTGLDWTADQDLGAADFPGYEIKTKNVDNYRNGDLFVKAYKVDPGPRRQAPSMIYVLAETSPDVTWVDFVGWTTLGTLAEHPETEIRNHSGACYMMPRRHLFPIGGLPCLRR